MHFLEHIRKGFTPGWCCRCKPLASRKNLLSKRPRLGGGGLTTPALISSFIKHESRCLVVLIL